MQILGRKNVKKTGKTSFFGVRRLAGTSASTGQKNVQIQFRRNRRRQAEYQNPDGEEAHMMCAHRRYRKTEEEKKNARGVGSGEGDLKAGLLLFSQEYACQNAR